MALADSLSKETWPHDLVRSRSHVILTLENPVLILTA